MRICANNQLSHFVWVLQRRVSFFPAAPHFTDSFIASFLPNFTPHSPSSSFTFHQQFQFSIPHFFSLLHFRKHFFFKHFRHYRHRGTVQNCSTLTKYRYFGLQLAIFSEKKELDNGVIANGFEELLRNIAVQGGE